MKGMKGGIIIFVGVLLMIIVFVMLFAVMTCTNATNRDAFYCAPFAQLTETIAMFF